MFYLRNLDFSLNPPKDNSNTFDVIKQKRIENKLYKLSTPSFFVFLKKKIKFDNCTRF